MRMPFRALDFKNILSYNEKSNVNYDSIQLTIAVAARNCTRGVLFKPGTQVMRMSSVFAPTVGIPRFSIGLPFEKGGEVLNHIRQTYLMHQANHVAKGMLANPDKSSIP